MSLYPNWVPFIEREADVVYKCNVCLDYGGVVATNMIDDEGMPLMQSCQDCPTEDDRPGTRPIL